MKRFVASLNGDGGFINLRADRMELIDNMLHVFCDNALVAVVDISCVLAARLDDKGM